MAAGDPVYSALVVSAKDLAITNGSTNSVSTFVNSLTTTGIRGVSFIAPPSGKVRVMGAVGGFVAFSSASVATYTLVDFEIRAGSTVGSGTVFRASDPNTCSQFQHVVLTATLCSGGQHTVLDVVTGLTPGAVYNACLTYCLNSTGTGISGNFNRRKIVVESVQ